MFDKTQPLGLPRGSVRAILTLMFSAVTAAMFLTQKEIPGPLWAIDLVVILEYFRSSTDRELNQADTPPEPVVDPPED